MKTSLACLGILIGALLLGRWQGARLGHLDNRIEYPKASRTMKASHRAEREDRSDYRTKYARRTVGTTSGEVYERLLSLKAPAGGNMMGPGAALQHREAMEAILQLDLKGIGELMSLVYQSKKLAKTFPMQQIAATLCLIAMADSSPDAAFAHLTENKEWNHLFSSDHIPDDGMLSYVLARMAVDDPQRALDSMRKLENTPKALNDDSIRRLLGQIARRDPALALDVIAELPDADRKRNYQMISHGMESDNERTVLFLSVREALRSKPAEQKLVLKTLCDRFGDSQNSMAESRKWLESLGMTDAEKNLVLDPLCRVLAEGYSTSLLDNARWFAKFMPPSDERDSLILQRIEPALGHEPASMHSFCRELGIDLERMRKIEMSGN